MTMNELYEPEKLQAIIDECNEHNADIGADKREPDRVKKDAEYIYMHRHAGITVETLCMMLTDFQFALRAVGVPAPQGPGEIKYEIIKHGKGRFGKEKKVGEVFAESPRKAIDKALALGIKGGFHCVKVNP